MISPTLQPLKLKVLKGRTALSLQRLAGVHRGVRMRAPVTKVIESQQIGLASLDRCLYHPRGLQSSKGLADIYAYLDMLGLQHGGDVPGKTGHCGANEH